MKEGQAGNGLATVRTICLLDRILAPFSAQPGNARLFSQQGLCGYAAGDDQDIRRLERDMPLDKGQAGRDLVLGGVAVSGRAPVDDIGHIDRVLAQADGGEHLVEQVSGRPHELADDEFFGGCWRRAGR